MLRNKLCLLLILSTISLGVTNSVFADDCKNYIKKLTNYTDSSETKHYNKLAKKGKCDELRQELSNIKLDTETGLALCKNAEQRETINRLSSIGTSNLQNFISNCK